VGADINPRVVDHLRRSRQAPPTLTLASEIRETETVRLVPEYRDYFAHLGAAIAVPERDGRTGSIGAAPSAGQLRKTITVGPAAARTLDAVALDLVTERLDGDPFDLVIATNILPYFNDVELMLAVSNIAAMLRPGGILLHNEARAAVADVTTAVGLPFQQARQVTIADVRGAVAPLFDSVWLHVKQGP
jgi:SAM-dependent methyltransferase